MVEVQDGTAPVEYKPHGHPQKSRLYSKIEVMSCLFILNIFQLEVCQDQWSSWGIFWFGFMLHPKMS